MPGFVRFIAPHPPLRSAWSISTRHLQIGRDTALECDRPAACISSYDRTLAVKICSCGARAAHRPGAWPPGVRTPGLGDRRTSRHVGPAHLTGRWLSAPSPSARHRVGGKAPLNVPRPSRSERVLMRRRTLAELRQVTLKFAHLVERRGAAVGCWAAWMGPCHSDGSTWRFRKDMVDDSRAGWVVRGVVYGGGTVRLRRQRRRHW